MSRSPITLDFGQVEEETLQASQFLKLVKENPGLIKSSKVIHPRQGEKSFGKIRVRYTHPILKMATQ